MPHMPNKCRECAEGRRLGLEGWRCPKHAANWVAKQIRAAEQAARYRAFLKPPKAAAPDPRVQRILEIRARIDRLPPNLT